MKITRQKIQAVLRKAGHPAAQFHRSAMVRGWGEWTSGPRVKEVSTGKFEIEHMSFHRGQEHINLERYQKALKAAGIEAAFQNDKYTVRLVVENKPAPEASI